MNTELMYHGTSLQHMNNKEEHILIVMNFRSMMGKEEIISRSLEIQTNIS